MKKLHHARELSRNQQILRFDVILQHDWPIEHYFLHIRVFFGRKTKRPCFDLSIHWMIKQITNTYRNHFSRPYENRSINESTSKLYLTEVHDNTLVYFLPQVSSENLNEWDLQCWNFAVHEDSGEIKLNLESHVNLQEMKHRWGLIENSGQNALKTFRIITRFWETAHLPLP